MGDTIEVLVTNHLIDAQVTIEWDGGIEVKSRPQAPVQQQGGQAKYVLLAVRAGTFQWRASSALQAAQGLKGALVIQEPQADESEEPARWRPTRPGYGAERLLLLADARQRADVCLTDAGDGSSQLLSGCPEIDKATLNGQWGDGSRGWPLPVIEVQQGECYRLRMLGLMNLPKPYFKVSVQDHDLQVVSSGAKVSEVEVHAGEGVSVVLCADRRPWLFKDYQVTLQLVGESETKAFAATLRYTHAAAARTAPAAAATAQAATAEVPLEEHAEAPMAAAAFDRSQCDRDVVFDLRDWVVDYLRPTARLNGAANATPPPPDGVPESQRRSALLVNGSYPGPVLEATEGELVCVTVVNNFADEPASIHWHGQHMKGFPAFDGVYGVSQAAISPSGGSMTYRWRANAGTHFYHGHMQALQADRGLKGPIVVQAKNDPHRHLYDEERLMVLSDEWADPGVCLRSEGAQPGNPVCAEIDKASWNGQWGDGSDAYPWPLITVERGRCYRLRFIGMMGQAQNFQMQIAGHNMTLIAVDGADVEPVKVSQFNLHAGERADIVLCADQEPGNYLVSAVYDLATFLETAPAPRMPRVDSSKFWAFLHYAGHDERPGRASKKLLGGYDPPAGTGGGASPRPTAGIKWDTNLRSGWSQVRNLHVEPQPEKADVTYVLDVGVASPAFEAGVTPYATSDRMYMFTEIRQWKKPSTPLLHTKGECGAEGVPFITVPENATTVEVVINNLSPTAHVLHMHGMRFSVVNYAPFSESWCSNAHFECFFLPLGVAKVLDCPSARLGDPSKEGPGSLYWGCPYDAARDAKSQMLEHPLQKDMISLWRRSWAVIRFKVENPGVWLFHCHMEQHIPTGQVMAFSLLPSQQPPIPADVPSEGPCPKWSGGGAPARPPKPDGFLV